MPAPEPIDVEPMKKADPEPEKEEEKPRRGKKDSGRIRVGIPDDDRDHRESRDDRDNDRDDDRNYKSSAKKRRDTRDYDDDEDRGPVRSKSRRDNRDDERRRKYADDDEDDQLFERSEKRESSARKNRNDRRDEDYADDRKKTDKETSRHSRDNDDEVAEKGWRKGRQFIIEDEEDDVENRPFFARKKRKNRDEERRETLRFRDEEAEDDREPYDPRDDERYRDEDGDDEVDYRVVDADWEDVEDEGPLERGFGRRIRNQRRRATAIARLEDVRPLDPDALDEEFFATLKVTPRELESAIRKARRRAEAREKNRLTPFRAFGWAVWLFVVAGVCYGIVTYRDDIVKIAPGTADAYAVIGIEANPYGLAIDNVRHRLAMSTNGPTIEITGQLKNETAGVVNTPLLQAEALGARGQLLARWTFTASEAQVLENGMVEFVTRAPAPDGVTEVALSFAPETSTVLESLLPVNE
ncbi:hypothetical protein [Hyphococcus sp. DH-69]|uniref:hypothetical protein n=1 Tax=Hyphococcus formosus TaxID=3143534 RepID=UPI00398B3A4E